MAVQLETVTGTRRQALVAGLVLLSGWRPATAAAQEAIPRYTFLVREHTRGQPTVSRLEGV